MQRYIEQLLAANYGFDEQMAHVRRYDRMEEFVDVCCALWDSVEPSTFIWDHNAGIVGDPTKVHRINYSGEFFKVRGPLNSMPSPQGRPVLIRAAGSPRGIQASAHFAEHTFGAAKPQEMQIAHRKDLDEALRANGRDPEQIGILWDILVGVGETEASAKAHRERLLMAIPSEGVPSYLIMRPTTFDPDRFTPSRGGFMTAHPQSTPRDLANAVDFLVPELRRRGRFRTEYGGTTLRDRLGVE